MASYIWQPPTTGTPQARYRHITGTPPAHHRHTAGTPPARHREPSEPIPASPKGLSHSSPPQGPSHRRDLVQGGAPGTQASLPLGPCRGEGGRSPEVHPPSHGLQGARGLRCGQAGPGARGRNAPSSVGSIACCVPAHGQAVHLTTPAGQHHVGYHLQGCQGRVLRPVLRARRGLAHR